MKRGGMRYSVGGREDDPLVRTTAVNAPLPDGYSKDHFILMNVKKMAPIEVGRRPGETAVSAAKRHVDIQTGCYGD